MSGCRTFVAGFFTLALGTVGLAGTSPIERSAKLSALTGSGATRQIAACCTLGGICEGTEKPIPKARLEAQPWARYCVEYARMIERGLAEGA